jgi:hypothetical protein
MVAILALAEGERASAGLARQLEKLEALHYANTEAKVVGITQAAPGITREDFLGAGEGAENVFVRLALDLQHETAVTAAVVELDHHWILPACWPSGTVYQCATKLRLAGGWQVAQVTTPSMLTQ